MNNARVMDLSFWGFVTPSEKIFQQKANSLFWVAEFFTHSWMVTSKNAVGYLVQNSF